MAKSIQAIRGMCDILPDNMALWQHIEEGISSVIKSFGYQKIQFPVLEMTELFSRTIGEETDIIGKEMYTFKDRNGDSISLRPEGTAGCVRAGIEHGLFYHQIQRLWYLGPMFRHERPQQGRYRQFQQWGVEVIGVDGHSVEAELLQICQKVWQHFDVQDMLTLELNTLGSVETRLAYRDILVAYFSQYRDQLSDEEQVRLASNPLRLLDSKNPDLAELIATAPILHDSLDDDSKQHFDDLQELLTQLGIAYTHNPHLVRGLDYYNNSVFEWTSKDLGAQNTVCAGGRYDGLVERLGGHATPALGFALGIERLCALVAKSFQVGAVADVVIVFAQPCWRDQAASWLAAIRQQLGIGYSLVVDHAGGSLKSQLKRADRLGARYVLLMGEDEYQAESFMVKPMTTDEDQVMIKREVVAKWLSERLAKEG